MGGWPSPLPPMPPICHALTPIHPTLALTPSRMHIFALVPPSPLHTHPSEHTHSSAHTPPSPVAIRHCLLSVVVPLHTHHTLYVWMDGWMRGKRA